jgi:hypothetical protein
MTARNHRIRLCQNNLAAASGATVTYSSAAASFPGSNALAQERWKRWITAGAFKVTSSNKTIYIADGSNKTVTLTEATYAGGAALAAHIQTQLNASSSNWTCTYSTSTYKFTIGRSSGTATLRLTQTTNAAWSMLGYLGVADVSAGTGLAADAVRVHTSERVDIDLGASKQVRAFFAIGQAGEDFPISSTATMTLKGDDIQANIDASPTVSVTLSLDSYGNGVFRFLDDLAATTLRYWRWEFSDKDNPNGPAFPIAQIFLGDYVTFSRNFSLGFKRTLVDPSIVTYSQAGVPYVSRRTKFWRYEAQVQYLIDEDRTEAERVFSELGVATPFFVALDPLAQLSASVGEWTKYVQFEQIGSMDHAVYKYFNSPYSMREVVG